MRNEKAKGAIGKRLAQFTIVWITIWFAAVSASSPLLAQIDGTPTTFLPFINTQEGTTWRWTNSTEVELVPRPSSGPLAVLDHLGQTHLFWDTRQTPRFIYHSYLGAADWSAPVPIAESLGSATLLYRPLVDENGNLHLVWRADLGSGTVKRYRLMYSMFDGTKWGSAEEIVQNDFGGITAMPHLDDNGNVLVTSINDNVLSSRATQFSRAETWSQKASVSPGHTVILVWPDMQGGIRFYGWGAGTDYSYWQNGEFKVQALDIKGKVSSRTTQLDGTQSLHVFWTGQVPVAGGTTRGIYYECLDPNLAWSPQEVITQQSEVAGTPQSYADITGYFTMAWQETAPTSRVRLSLRQGCIPL